MTGPSWQSELAARIRSPGDLPSFIKLTNEEQAFFDGLADFGMAIPPHVLEQLRSSAQAHDGVVPIGDPLRLQSIPTVREQRVLDYEMSDPLGEDTYKVGQRVIHRYPDRVLILVTDECALHCRHCFRRRFTGSSAGALTDAELAEAAAYVGDRPEVREVLLSGGDALLLPDSRLERIATSFRHLREDIVLRIATRAPVVIPSRITIELLAILSAVQPVWLVTQFNHPAEINSGSIEALEKIIGAGIPVVNQTVLIRGVNDDASILSELFTQLVSHRVKPYYLFQGDLAPGTSHFRTSIARGLDLMRELRTRISGLAMPTYAVDIPGGGGKVRLEGSAIVGERAGAYEILSPDGVIHSYPKEAT